MSKKITPLSLYVISFIFCILAIIVLLIPFNVTFKQSVYAAPPGELRTELSSDSSNFQKNFFDYIDYLKNHDYPTTEENLFVVFLILSLLASVLPIITDTAFFMRKITVSNKAIKIVSLSIAVFPLISFILAISLQESATYWHMCDYEPIYIPGYSDWNIYEEASFRGSVTLVPAIIFMFVAFSSHCAAGVLKLNLIPSLQDNLRLFVIRRKRKG